MGGEWSGDRRRERERAGRRSGVRVRGAGDSGDGLCGQQQGRAVGCVRVCVCAVRAAAGVSERGPEAEVASGKICAVHTTKGVGGRR